MSSIRIMSIEPLLGEMWMAKVEMHRKCIVGKERVNTTHYCWKTTGTKIVLDRPPWETAGLYQLCVASCKWDSINYLWDWALLIVFVWWPKCQVQLTAYGSWPIRKVTTWNKLVKNWSYGKSEMEKLIGWLWSIQNWNKKDNPTKITLNGNY